MIGVLQKGYYSVTVSQEPGVGQELRGDTAGHLRASSLANLEHKTHKRCLEEGD